MRFTRATPASDRQGFTIVELAIVVMISSILIGVAVPRIQATFQQRDVNSARDGVILMAARARARAMETAATVEFRLLPGDARVVLVQGGTTVETFDFGDDLGVVAHSEAGDLVMCYTARGFATEPCSTHLSGPVRVEFWRRDHTAVLEVWQLGQLRKL